MYIQVFSTAQLKKSRCKFLPIDCDLISNMGYWVRLLPKITLACEYISYGGLVKYSNVSKCIIPLYPLHVPRSATATTRQKKSSNLATATLLLLLYHYKLFVTIHTHYIDFFCGSKAIPTTRANVFSCTAFLWCCWYCWCTVSTLATTHTETIT